MSSKRTERPLTAKQKRFIREVIRQELTGRGSNTKAAIAAGDPPRAATEIAAENLAKPGIREAIERRRAELRQQADIEDLEVIGLLASHMRGQITDLMNERGEVTQDSIRTSGCAGLIKKFETEVVTRGAG